MYTDTRFSVEGLSPIAEPTVSNYEDTLTVNEHTFYRVIATNDTHNTTFQ